MEFNGATFNKAQQDQIKKKVGAELDNVVAKIDGMLNYTGDWATGNEYHENDVVTWDTDGHLYEVIKAHTSNTTLKPSNTEYYKAMTSTRVIAYTAHLVSGENYFDETTYNFIYSISDKIIYAETDIATLSRPNLHGAITFSSRSVYNTGTEGMDIEDYTFRIATSKYASLYRVRIKPNNTIEYQAMDVKSAIEPSGITFYYTL